jgi:hypothetical protein
VVCSADLSGDALKDPMRRQLRSSLVNYLSKQPPSEVPSLTPRDLGILFREVDATHQENGGEWSKDLEPPPLKK